MRRRSTTAAPASACLDICPTACVPRALPARRAALHFLPHDRAQGADRARAAPADGQPHLRLRRLPRGLSLEQVRPARPRGEACARATCLRSPPTLAELAALDDAAFRALFAKTADQAHRARPLRAQRADRDRQLRRCLACVRGRAQACRRLGAGARCRGLGARAARAAAAICVRSAARRRDRSRSRRGVGRSAPMMRSRFAACQSGHHRQPNLQRCAYSPLSTCGRVRPSPAGRP